MYITSYKTNEIMFSEYTVGGSLNLMTFKIFEKISLFKSQNLRVYLVPILNGGAYIFAEIMERSRAVVGVNFLSDCNIVLARAKSYKGMEQVQSEPSIWWSSEPSVWAPGSGVILVDDILDTGSTLYHLKEILLKNGAKSVVTAVLVERLLKKKYNITADICELKTCSNDYLVFNE